MTQRKLTADEQELAYNLLHALNRAALLISARGSATAMIDHIGGMVRNGTSDGKPPIQADRVPTAADIGKRVKVRLAAKSEYSKGGWFVGFDRSGWHVIESSCHRLSSWQFCIIDQEADK
jgi:hypothetical protein